MGFPFSSRSRGTLYYAKVPAPSGMIIDDETFAFPLPALQHPAWDLVLLFGIGAALGVLVFFLARRIDFPPARQDGGRFWPGASDRRA